jgi:hypothetical protein
LVFISQSESDRQRPPGGEVLDDPTDGARLIEFSDEYESPDASDSSEWPPEAPLAVLSSLCSGDTTITSALSTSSPFGNN